MQIQGQRAVQYNHFKWNFSDADPPLTLNRTIGPQQYMITTATEVATFWLDGGVNALYTGFGVKYGQSRLLPPNGGCSVFRVPPPVNSTSVYTDIFQLVTSQGVILVFRFSPIQVLPAKVEVGAGSEDFTATIFLITPQHGSDQNPRSEAGHYSEAVNEYVFPLSSGQLNVGVPIPLMRLVGEQTWFIGVSNGGVYKEGGVLILKYGDSGTYIGMIVATGNAVISFTEGLNIVQLPVPVNSGLEYAKTFRLTTTSYSFDIWIHPTDHDVTIRSVGPIVAGADMLVIKMQKVMFRA